MRKEGNIPLQITIAKEMLDIYEQNAKKRGFTSKSEYIKYLLLMDNKKIKKGANA